jgi:hypothetical protein
MAAWVFLTLALAPLAPAAPTLTLVWHDTTQQFPGVGLARLADEMEALFRQNGLSVDFRAASDYEDLSRIPEPRINAIVLPGEDRRFGLPADAMAAAFGEKGGKYGIFVFLPSVRRTLGHRESETSPRHLVELSRALARIVAHELVHVLAPERGHADSGLMSVKLRREELLADVIDLDGVSLARATATLRAWGCRTRTSGLPIPIL